MVCTESNDIPHENWHVPKKGPIKGNLIFQLQYPFSGAILVSGRVIPIWGWLILRFMYWIKSSPSLFQDEIRVSLLNDGPWWGLFFSTSHALENPPLYVFFSSACIVPFQCEHKRACKPWRFGWWFSLLRMLGSFCQSFSGTYSTGLGVAHLARWIQWYRPWLDKDFQKDVDPSWVPRPADKLRTVGTGCLQ